VLENEAGATSMDAVRGVEFLLVSMANFSCWIYYQMQMNSTRPPKKKLNNIKFGWCAA